MELKQLKLASIESAIEVLEKQAKINLNSEANSIVRELLDEYDWAENAPDSYETKTAVTKAVKKLIKFTNSGGQVDARLNVASSEQPNFIEEVRKKNNIISSIQKELELLKEYKEILQIEDHSNDETE